MDVYLELGRMAGREVDDDEAQKIIDGYTQLVRDPNESCDPSLVAAFKAVAKIYRVDTTELDQVIEKRLGKQ